MITNSFSCFLYHVKDTEALGLKMKIKSTKRLRLSIYGQKNQSEKPVTNQKIYLLSFYGQKNQSEKPVTNQKIRVVVFSSKPNFTKKKSKFVLEASFGAFR